MSGEVRLNGKKYTLHDLKMNAGYGAPRLRCPLRFHRLRIRRATQ